MVFGQVDAGLIPLLLAAGGVSGADLSTTCLIVGARRGARGEGITGVGSAGAVAHGSFALGTHVIPLLKAAIGVSGADGVAAIHVAAARLGRAIPAARTLAMVGT